MHENVYLHGSEDVRAAGQQMRAAAEEMSRAASTIDGALERHRLFMDEWLARLEDTMKGAPK